jgi:hypothetical protein
LGDVKGVPPIMVRHVAVILLDAQQPSTKNFIVDVKSLDQIQIEKHSQTGLGILKKEKKRLLLRATTTSLQYYNKVWQHKKIHKAPLMSLRPPN